MITDDTEARVQRRAPPVSVFARADCASRRRAGALRGWRQLRDGAERRRGDAAAVRRAAALYAGRATAAAELRASSPLAATEEAGSEVERLNGERETIVKEMTRLKGVLYAKFGDAINLED